MPGGIYRIGRSIIRPNTSTSGSKTGSRNVSKNATPRRASPIGKKDAEVAPGVGSEEPTPSDEALSLPILDGEVGSTGNAGKDKVVGLLGRSIRFPDEQPHGVRSAEREL